MLDSYQRLAKYYDLIYDYKDYNKESDFIQKIFRKYALSRPRRILDLGCGTGGHVIPLARKGYSCCGIDLSAQMIRLAREKAREYKIKNVDFKICGMQNFSIPKKFDAVISMSSAICFLTTYRDFKLALDKIKASLKKNGILLFDFWNGFVVINQFSPTKVAVRRRGAEELIRVSRTKLDLSRQQVLVDINVKLIKNKAILDEFKDKHTVRFYFLDEMRNYLEINGFKVLHICPFGQLDKNANITKDWNVTIISRKV